MYCFNRTKDFAAQRINPWIKNNTTMVLTVDGFFFLMDTLFVNQNIKRQAREQLHIIKQNERDFHIHHAEFLNLTVRAEALKWDNTIRIDLLERLLDHELLAAMIRKERPAFYDRFVDQCSGTYDQIQRLKRIQNGQATGTNHPPAWNNSLASIDVMD